MCDRSLATFIDMRGKWKPQTKVWRSSSITACHGSASQGVGDQPGSPSGHTGALIIPNSSSAADQSDIPLPRLSSDDKVLLTLYTLNQHLSWDQRLCPPPPMQMWKALLFGSSAGSAPEGSDPGWAQAREQAGFRSRRRCRAVLGSPAHALLPAGHSTARGVSHPARHRLLR